MAKRKWKCNISYDANGTPQLFAFDSKGFVAYLESLKPNTVSVTVEKWKDTPSHPQFKYYYGVVLGLIAEETGMDCDTLDAILKQKFLYKYEQLNGEAVKRPLSKTEVTTERFCQYVDQVVEWSREFLNLVIPQPNTAEG
jgi:hypothetical protein